MPKWLRTSWQVVCATLSGFGKDELVVRAAALAFYTALSFAPLLVLLLWVVASLQPEWQARLVNEISSTIGPRAAEAVKMVIANAKERPGLGDLAAWIGAGATLFSASLVFAQLQGALNRVWGLRARPGRALRGWIRTRLRGMGLLLALAFLLVVSFAASAVITILVPGDSLALMIVDIIVTLAVFVCVFAALFHEVPDAIVEWRDAFAGAGFTVVLFVIGKFALGYYMAHSTIGGAYGPAGALVVLLVWVYYSAIILLVGAELTEAIAEARGEPIRPNPHADASATKRKNLPDPETG
ncbi:MAG TPA: YihY/virulence factor BrkB family protein [Rhodanobacteraceae bacterium]|nr:YihY/virulence factor BrkB family protein [Rhodanobacteraceae bacterium]